MKNILVLCTGNSCRSQMAEGYLKALVGDKFGVYSAGIETHGVNPTAINVMNEDGVDISGHTSNNILEYAGYKFDYIITVCDNASENCPYYASSAKRFHQNFPDPAKTIGNEEEIMNVFRSTRNLIREYCTKFIQSQL